MVVDDGLALAPTARGFWPGDEWLAAESLLPILVYEPSTSIRIEFWLPPGFAPRRAKVRVDNWSAEVSILPDQATSVDIPLRSQSKGAVVNVEIEGAAPAPPPDVRIVGGILAGIRRVVEI